MRFLFGHPITQPPGLDDDGNDHDHPSHEVGEAGGGSVCEVTLVLLFQCVWKDEVLVPKRRIDCLTMLAFCVTMTTLFERR
jgi:hypothetical protein